MSVNYCIGHGFTKFEDELKKWFRVAGTELEVDTLLVVEKILFEPLAHAIDYIVKKSRTHLSVMLLEIANFVKLIIASNAGPAVSHLNVIAELAARIVQLEDKDTSLCAAKANVGAAMPLCFASHAVQIVSMLIDPVVIKTAVLNIGAKMLGDQVKLIQSFIMKEEKDSTIKNPELLRFVEIGHGRQLRRYHLPSTQSFNSIQQQKHRQPRRRLLMAECAGDLDLTETVLCAVNNEAKNIEWTPMKLLDTRNLKIIENHVEYGWGIEAGKICFS
jgi:hypothetical protein